MMEAGKLNRRLTFLRPVPNRDSVGADLPTWEEVCTVWAGMRPLTGRALALAQANTITSTASHEFSIRYRTDLKTTFQVRYIGDGSTPPRKFTINAIIDPAEDHTELRITATEVVG